ncbi:MULTISPECIES: flagellar biosynthesis protein FlhB [unclassified Polaromonas]|jgi:flagellar biosynthetic protein FlhB|uniref:flagellar biosynthesis protein FlhB n=1 Tax=unclassified Polaromonas TaxID=2638319 RepID=UPI0018CAF625|nr:MULTISPECIES: flagellar biosynthesis protein FlhB [unclassified Polaromonas]MBG6070456.1 flagellar biosynthetic protein FlhB [Polaromonas sp. CG_9.7]MBG6112454.1 flagellar biosynthetic protein FlhB [Polaromonas sp. CG_9.2]MDH6184102.1 flagellar biosynthetic protein FlhB [Polaromonas sp. CG_23.6]
MAEESDLEKTEPASPRRLEKAHEEGQVARSRELVTFVMLSTGLGCLWATGDLMASHLGSALRNGMQFERASAFDASQMLVQAEDTVFHVLQALVPLLAAMLLAALVAPMLLGGWLLSGKSLSPKFSKLNPIAGIGRMFSTETLAELVKTIVKSLLIGGIAWWVISGNLQTIMALMSEPVHEALAHTLRLVASSCALIIGSLLLVAAIDVPYQLWSHQKKLRMSREDLRQEQKESDGDPQVKAQIRRQQQQMAKRRMMAEVPKADIIVTNPTHFAVALKYSDKDMRAPRVIAKGTDLVALRIRALAQEHNIPVLEAPPLTRALYRHTALGAEIPADLYAAVAEVLAWAYQLQRQTTEGGALPPRPKNLPVPESLDSAESPA